MKDFEANLAHLEQLTNDIKRTDISLESALKDFEEGITLAKKLEKDIEKIEGKIQILMNQPAPNTTDTPELDLFTAADAGTGSAGAPAEGLRQHG